MRAVRIVSSQQKPALAEVDVPQPTAARGEVLIEVYASGVTPTELLWYPTWHTQAGGARSGAIPSHEFSGVIAGLGEDVEAFTVGDEIYGMNDWFADGATAEYCVTVPLSIARKPTYLTHAQAAAVPIAALTAWQGLFDRAKLQAGERVLIHGGAGAVGVFAIQLARLRGAEVIATASARNKDFVSQLGAQQVIDYTSIAFEHVARNVDVVFDSVGGETLQRSWSVLKPGGRLVTIAASSEPDQRIKDAFFIVEPDQRQLIEIGELLDTGKLKVLVDVELPFSSASAAYTQTITRPHGHGKVVIVTPAYEKKARAEQ